jgi:preprotein translocase subunit SecG
MLTFITLIHFTVAILLIVFVLIQDSKGGGVFGMGASGSNQVFSATGAANFLVKATRTLAILFAITCITLTYMTTHKTSSVTDDFVPAAAAPTDSAAPPVTTEAPAASTPAESPTPEKK